MLPRLFEFSQRDEEGVRNVVAECAGKLAAAAPDAVVPALLERLDASSPLTRCTVVNSLRFTLTEWGGAPMPPVLLASLRKFLGALQARGRGMGYGPGRGFTTAWSDAGGRERRCGGGGGGGAEGRGGGRRGGLWDGAAEW